MSPKERKVPPSLEGLDYDIYFYSDSYAYTPETLPTARRIYQLGYGLAVLVSLLLNFLVATVLDSVNYIHAITLRWTLFHEERLNFNSNNRLFTASKSHGPNSWYFNVISGTGLVISHGSLSCMLADVTVENEDPQISDNLLSTKSFVELNALAVTALGLGLLLQVCVSTYSLLCSSGVLTWSNNLLANAQAIARSQKYQRQNCAKFPSRTLQDSMLNVAPKVRPVRYLVWGFFGLFAAWSLGQGIYTGLYQEQTLLDLDARWPKDALEYWKFYGTMWFDPRTTINPSASWITLLVQIILQSFLALALHCLELQFNLFSDEAVWHSMETVGSKPNPSILSSFIRQGLFLSVIKAILHWIFGYAFFSNLTINIALLPIIALMAAFMLLVALTEYMMNIRSKGRIPATYGNFEKVLELVDDWSHEKLFWGDKGDLLLGLRRAGTAGEKLPELHPNILYCCPQASELENGSIISPAKMDPEKGCDRDSDRIKRN
ncbi:uncharacterized protein N7496_005582 [Penicillium cataractarum]|uniref:Uncharacterized protein n=1 Tax=Penicillium cataractarum TaxID=2100454 RepID=A0A9W9VDJ0_9EURO|nr:uncharacterized protein N7496_005582 [Penicillium cataractarum]KAJ5378173.1 hypothetical protein N7496_005582 [Penicillium cataractarum]